MSRFFLIFCFPVLLFAQDISWWDNSKAEFNISTAEQLKGVAKLVNDGTTNFIGKTISLSNDITLTGNFIPIGKDSIFPSRIFLGNFDGKGHSISGLSVENQRAAGLFGFAFGNIRNLTVNASKIKTSDESRVYAGVLAGVHGYGSSYNIENCYVTADSVIATGSGDSFSGGLAGFNMGKILNSYFIGNVSAAGKAVAGGGLAGASAVLTIEHSHFTGNVSAAGTSSAHAGGLVGHGGDISYTGDNISELRNRSKITISNSYSKGDILSNASEGASAGGLVGVIMGTTEISRSYSIGNISSKANSSIAASSGFLAMLAPILGGPVTISNSYFIGEISAISNSKDLGDNKSFSGGLTGYNYQASTSITNSYASGEISGSTRIGGIFGVYSNGTVKSTYYNSEGASQAAGDGSPAGIEAKSMSELKMKKTFADWDFDVIWEIEETSTTPFLNSQYLVPSSSSIGNSSSSSLTPSSSSSLTSSSSSLENLSSSSSLTLSSSSESTQISAIVIENAISLQVQNSVRLDIYSINGKLEKTLYFKNGVYNIPLNDLPKGMYIVKETFGREKRIFKIPVM